MYLCFVWILLEALFIVAICNNPGSQHWLNFTTFFFLLTYDSLPKAVQGMVNGLLFWYYGVSRHDIFTEGFNTCSQQESFQWWPEKSLESVNWLLFLLTAWRRGKNSVNLIESCISKYKNFVVNLLMIHEIAHCLPDIELPLGYS